MKSYRLPGKALAVYCPDGTTTNLAQIVGRWRASYREPNVIVTTTSEHSDDLIEVECNRLGVPCSRGHPTNLVEQMDKAVKTYAPNAAYIARGLCDNPLVSVDLADWRLDVLREAQADLCHYSGQESRMSYCATTDIYSRKAWDEIVAHSSGCQLEHPGLFAWENLNKFHAIPLPLPAREYLASVRTELDAPEDLEMFKALWHSLHDPSDPCVSTLEALRWLVKHPEVSRINSHVQIKTQSRPIWPKGLGWLCENCRSRVGGIVSGDLQIPCSRCGQVRKFYARKPTHIDKTRSAVVK
jgi:spore coat polysaccharide biosynthesis protein SpsF